VERWKVVAGRIVITHAGVVFVHILLSALHAREDILRSARADECVSPYHHHSGWIIVRMVMFIAVHTFAEWKMLRIGSCSSGCGKLEAVSVRTLMYSELYRE
jgi:hypothetical protein